jgi:chromosome partitioning protein
MPAGVLCLIGVRYRLWQPPCLSNIGQLDDELASWSNVRQVDYNFQRFRSYNNFLDDWEDLFAIALANSSFLVSISANLFGNRRAVCYNSVVRWNKDKDMIVAIANQKGGVGKTTTAVNVAGFLAQRDRRVLLVDMDPQGNAATCLGIAKQALQHTVGDVLLGNIEAKDVIINTGRPRYDLLPATPDLAGTAVTLTNLPEREFQLRHALEPVLQQYDWILIDCPPSLGLLTINGLVAAQQVVIPLQCEYLALEGLVQLRETIEVVQNHLNPPLHIGGLVMTMYDGRGNLARQVVEEVQRYFPRRVFKTLIPRTVRLSEAPSHGELVFEYDPRSRGAQAYAILTEELLRGETVA